MRFGPLFLFVGILPVPVGTASAEEPQENSEGKRQATNSQDIEEVEEVEDECDDGFFGTKIVPPHCKTSSRDLEFALLPGVFTQKETGLGFALYGEMTFFTDESPETQASRLALSFAYTLNQQFLVKIPTFINFKNNDHIIEGYADFRIYPNRYYGIGGDTDWDYQVYSENVLTTFYEFRKRIWKQFYGGLVWNLRSAFKFSPEEYYDEFGEETDSPEGGPLDADDPTGAEQNLNHGLGVELVYDSRDDFYAPESGGYHRTHINYFGSALGGGYDYLLWVVDARQYIKVGESQVLALQFLNEFRQGEVPFTSLAEFGGPFAMRGYFKGRYRDRHMSILQAEYRFPIYKRLSGVAFADAGEVYGAEPFSVDRLRWTAGAGARFRFGHRTYVRLDVGANQDTTALIFNGGHAF